MIDGKLIILLWSTIALRRKVFDVWLLGAETHWITTLTMRNILPQWLVLEPVIQSSKCKCAKRESGKKAGFLVLPQLVGACKRIVMVDKVIVSQAFFLCFIKDENNLQCLSA